MYPSKLSSICRLWRTVNTLNAELHEPQHFPRRQGAAEPVGLEASVLYNIRRAWRSYNMNANRCSFIELQLIVIGTMFRNPVVWRNISHYAFNVGRTWPITQALAPCRANKKSSLLHPPWWVRQTSDYRKSDSGNTLGEYIDLRAKHASIL